jgi:tubulin-specific chaperone A
MLYGVFFFVFFSHFATVYHCSANSLLKEVSYYELEVKENEVKLKEMKDQNKNRFDIKKFGEVLEESHMMIPDSNNRLEQALTDLATYVESAEVKELVENEWYVTALELLKENTNGQTGENIDEDIVEETDVSGLQEGEAF